MVYENLALLEDRDAEVASAVKKELERQQNSIELIASENFVSEAVMAANASVLTNKYAEGYPGKRYYGGCECVDIVETIAIERAKKLFGAEFAYSHSSKHSCDCHISYSIISFHNITSISIMRGVLLFYTIY